MTNAPPASWVIATADGAMLTLKIVPRASRDEVAGRHGEALRIRLRAPPVDQQANRALADFLGRALDVPRSRIEILSGGASRHKRVLVRGVTAAAVLRLAGESSP